MHDHTGKRSKRDEEEGFSLPQSKSVATDVSHNPPPAAAQPQPTYAEMQEHPIEKLVAHTLLPPPRSSSPTIEDCRRRQTIMGQVYSYEDQVKISMQAVDNSYYRHIPNEQAKWSLVQERYPQTKELIREAASLGDYDAATIAGYLNIPGYHSRDRIILC